MHHCTTRGIRRTSVAAVGLLLTASSLVLVPRPADAAGPELSTCATSWHVVPAAHPTADLERLAGVASVSATDAWAVGTAIEPLAEGPEGSGVAPVVEHWDGGAWTAATVPRPAGPVGSSLTDVAALSSSRVWAVGSTIWDTEHGTVLRPLVASWDGRRWTPVVVPGLGPLSNGELRGVVAVIEDDVWAVGTFLPDLAANEAAQPLTVHWDGVRWTAVTADPAVAATYPSARFDAVHAAGDEVWAVGSATRDGTVFESLVQRWDGQAWTHVPSPSSKAAARRSFGTTLRGVAVRGADDVVVVGTAGRDPYVLRWSGRRWARVRLVVDEMAGLASVAALADGRLVAVGSRVDATTFDGAPFAADLGRTGAVAPTEGVPGSFQTSLQDVHGAGGVEWAVGSSVAAREDGTVVERAFVLRRCTG